MKKLATTIYLVLFVVSCTTDPIIYTLTTSANPADGGSSIAIHISNTNRG